MIKWNWKIFVFLPTFFMSAKINIPQPFALACCLFAAVLAVGIVSRVLQSERAYIWRQHCTGADQLTACRINLRFHLLRSAFGTDVMVSFWVTVIAITHMGDKTCCQTWWTLLEVLVEFGSFYFGCFPFQTRHPIVPSFCSWNLCRGDSELQKAEQLPQLVPVWGSLKEQYGDLWQDPVLQSHL